MNRRPLTVAIGCCLLVLASTALAGAGTAAGAAGSGPHAGDAAAGPAAQTDVDPDTVLLEIDLQEGGDAVWTVSYRVALDDDNTTAAFRSIEADVEQDPENYSAAFERRMTRTVSAAENATGRSMTLRNLTVTTRNESLPQPTGVIVYRFDWTNFAVQDGEELRAGDAIDRLYLDDSTRLSISWPAAYRRTSVSPPTTRAEADEVVWAGPLDFDRGEPRVAVAPGAGPTTTDGGDAGGGGGATDLLLVAVVAALLAGAVWLFVRRAGLSTPIGRTEDDGADDARAEGAAESGTAAEGTAAGTGGGASESTNAGATGGAAPETPPEELLSNEERVRKVVRDAGGRIKQKQVAEELDWTAAKTSQVVGTLRDEDELEAFRLGRENVLRLPGEDPLGAPDQGDEAETDEGDAAETDETGERQGDES
jgi:hypothetical protein